MSEQDHIDDDRPLMAHLLELRNRLLRTVLAVLAVFIVLYVFSNPLYEWLSAPLQAVLPEGASMVAIAVASPFLIPMKLALVAAVFVCVPYILYQVWGFVAPGLYRHEKRLVWPLLVSSTMLFYLGGAFAYFVVFPLVFQFLTATTPVGVTMMTDISEYLDFVLAMFFAFGVAFEVPVATVLLVLTGAVSVESLREKRPYVVVGAFVIGMFLTPPDVISQILLALPMWLLFEVGLLVCARLGKREAPAEQGQ
jgi:sec-independent protein translocase protein TatC